MKSTIELLREINRLAHDPKAPDGDRANAAALMPLLLKHHGFRPDDLNPAYQDWCRFDPPPETEAEKQVALRIACLVREESPIPFRAGEGWLEVEATPEQWCEMEDCWDHHLPLLRQNWRECVEPEALRLQWEISKIQRELDLLPLTAARAFVLRADLVPHESETGHREPVGPSIPGDRLKAADALAERMTVAVWHRRFSKPLRKTAAGQ